jgi:predicted ribosomally synthesized peptide with SipW-like signal peptide
MDEKKEDIEVTNNQLDGPDTVVEQTAAKADDSNSLESEKDVGGIDDGIKPKPELSIAQRVEKLVRGVNIYLLLFILVILLAGIATFASFSASKKATNISIDGQTLSTEDLQNLKNNDTSVGDPKQTLTIASNAVFSGRVLVRDNLDVAGTIRVGGTISLPGITVSGTSAFENVQIGNNLSVAGNQAVQGSMTIQNSLSVGGSASFAGTLSAPALSIDKLIMNQNLQLNRHVEAGGPAPRIGNGPQLPYPGTVSINGSDTAGTVNLNFGPSTFGGILAIIYFANNFNQTPHVVITPVGSSCAGLNFYATRNTSSFSIGSSNAAPAGSSCSFDYIVFD